MTSLNVERPGFLSTVQDAGRDGWAHLGISASGAADALALRLGNLLVGNAAHAAAIEMTLVGGTFTFDADVVLALAGADFDAALAGRPLQAWMPARVGAGERIEIGPARTGARCYLCVRGGLDVPPALGSASTHLGTGLGGHGGRALRAGDVLPIGTPSPASRSRRVQLDRDWVRALYADAPLRVTPGPQSDWFAPDMLERFVSSSYTVLEQSDRMGIRLAGPAIARAASVELLTEGVALGAIQVPESGQPIILFVEHQTTGGYPKIANVCSADLHRVGQLRPRATVLFELVSFEAARSLILEREVVLTHLQTAESGSRTDEAR